MELAESSPGGHGGDHRLDHHHLGKQGGVGDRHSVRGHDRPQGGGDHLAYLQEGGDDGKLVERDNDLPGGEDEPGQRRHLHIGRTERGDHCRGHGGGAGDVRGVADRVQEAVKAWDRNYLVKHEVGRERGQPLAYLVLELGGGRDDRQQEGAAHLDCLQGDGANENMRKRDKGLPEGVDEPGQHRHHHLGRAEGGDRGQGRAGGAGDVRGGADWVQEVVKAWDGNFVDITEGGGGKDTHRPTW